MSDNEAQWVEDDYGNYYYYYSDGTMATGWMQSGDYWYYFDSSGKMATGWNNIDGDTYYFYSGGEMATGWIDSGNGWYYLYGNGSMAWGRTIDEYLLDNNGKMLTGTSWEYVDGNSYYLKDGKIATGWLEYGDDNWSYLYGNGTMAWGRTVEGCYIDDNGNWVQDVGWHQEGKYGTWYYVDSNGNAVTGWQKIDDQWYYFDEDGKMQTGWIKDKGNWYYLNDNGTMATGRKDIDGNRYYFYSTGEMASGCWIQYGDSWNYYYGAENGSMAYDTTIDGYYVNTDGEWEPSKDNSNTPENSDSSNSQETSNASDISDGEKPAMKLLTVDYNRLSTYEQRDLNALIDHLNMEDGEIWNMPAAGVGYLPVDREMVEAIFNKKIEFMNSDVGKLIEEYDFRAEKFSSGLLQAFGGFTEAGTGYTIAAGTSWTGIGIPIGVGGVYIAEDGISNFTGGISKAINGARGSLDNDTGNYIKFLYKSLVPNGEKIYNCTQIAIGLFTIKKGIFELPGDSYKVFLRPQNILKAEQQGLETETFIIDAGNKVVVTTTELNTATSTPMILKRVIIDKSKLTEGVLSIGVDNYNVGGAIDSIN